jgi:hypothetical protein
MPYSALRASLTLPLISLMTLMLRLPFLCGAQGGRQQGGKRLFRLLSQASTKSIQPGLTSPHTSGVVGPGVDAVCLLGFPWKPSHKWLDEWNQGFSNRD